MGDTRAVRRAPDTQKPAPHRAPARHQPAASPRVTGGPVFTLGGPVQRQVAIGQVNDRFEREANAIADRAVAGQKAGPVTTLAPGALAGGAQRAPAEEPEEPVQTLVQRAAAEEPEEPVQAQTEEEEPVQASGEGAPAGASPGASTGASPGAASGTPGGGRPSMESVAASAIRSKGAGRPLAPPTRSALEDAFGTDLSGVRVHDTPEAEGSSRALGARAFTHGSDIWLGQGESQSDLHLMAHETAHVLQQGGVVRRTPDEPPGQQPSGGQQEGGAAPAMSPATGVVQGEEILFDEIQVPSFKLDAHRGALYSSRAPLKQKKAYDRGATDQRRIWMRDLGSQSDTVQQQLTEKIKRAHRVETVDPSGTYVLEAPAKQGGKRYIIGDLPTVATELTAPSWGLDGNARSYDVDHIVELQLANWNTDGWANTLDNMELLESSANQSSGSTIKANIDAKVRSFIDATQGAYGTSVANVKANYHLVFNRAVPGGGDGVSRNDFWRMDQITAGEHLGPVVVKDPSVLGGPGQARVFPSASGGQGKQFAWRAQNTGPVPPASAERRWLDPYIVTSKHFLTEGDGVESTADFGTITINISPDDQNWKPLDADHPIPVRRVAGARYAGYIDKSSVMAKMRELRHKKMSPIRVDEFDILPDQGIYVSGAVLPETPLLQGNGIDFELSNGDLRLSKAFSTGEITVPPPLRVIDCSFVISAGTQSGIAVEGQIDFGIDRLGQGYLRGAASTGDAGFSLEGGFTFDTELFDPAEIELWYRDDQVGGAGRLGIGPDKIRGIRSAEIEARFEQGRFSATGTVQPNIPGVEQGDLSVTYSEEEGLTISGSLQLTEDVPGIRGGSVEVTVHRGEEGWRVAAGGTAQPDIPGVDTSLTVRYDDGLFTIEGSAAYERGMLAGSLQLGVTNRPVDEAGTPGGDPTDQLRAYGGGSVTVRFSPWLQGTAGIRLLENGEVELSGEIGLPDTLDIFDEKRIEKEIFSINIDIPIVGVAAAGQRIGIFATIGGGLTAGASIGPGQLRDVGLSVTYNPDREEETHITGGAQLYIPAQAGLRLFVQGGLGAGIPLVSATAGLEVGATLGLEGAIEAGVSVDWTPARGLVIDALGEIYVQPRFTFDVTGFVLVELDLLLTTIELYSQRWRLASFEYGSNLRFGVKFPVHYEEGQPFDISLSDVEFVVPEIDPMDMLTGLIGQIA